MHPDNHTSWFFKFCECVLAAIALLNLLLFPLLLLPVSFFEKYGHYLSYVLMSMACIALSGSLLYTWVWHRREQSQTTRSALQHAWLQGIIRYWLALSISTYGFAKILKTQFQTPDFLLDAPLNSVDGMSLTWYYFGYSYPLAVIIGLFQIGGSILLLYRRTTLLGVVILLPVMVNIVLINIFFTIAIGAFFNSIVYSLALVFLLLLHGKRLKQLFWEFINPLPPISPRRDWIWQSLRLLPVVIAFVSLKMEISNRPSDQALKGTWTVKKLIHNGQPQPAMAWATNRMAWTRVYFAGNAGCAFSPNPYRFDSGESLVGSYTFDSLQNKLEVTFYSHDTLRATISNRTTEAMRLQGILGRDTLDMQLARLHR